MNKIFFFFFGHMYVHFDFIVLAYPSPTASMWEMIDQWWQKQLQKVSWENASLLHDTGVPDAERGQALGALQQELPTE